MRDQRLSSTAACVSNAPREGKSVLAAVVFSGRAQKRTKMALKTEKKSSKYFNTV